MSYLFNTPEETTEMLSAIGVNSIDDLFEQIPESVRMDRPLNLPPAMSEMELESHVRFLAEQNESPATSTCFLGGGAYDHFIPSVVDEIASRGEYYTAYTPYQAEASQGTLQAFFEYQTLISQLTGMDVSNASLYEGATSVSEAAFMAMRVTNRHKKVVILGSVHPEFQLVLETYMDRLGCEVCTIPVNNGVVDSKEVVAQLDDTTACLIIQQPNFFGCLEEVEPLVMAAREVGALSVLSFDPLSLGVLKQPGEYGVDIAVAEGQSLGTPLQYGGPYLGIMACRKEFVRKMPGRLVGTTKDREGRDCFVLNLQTREQHIRRDKATSNICTNQGLLALRATIYMSLLGPQGLKDVSKLSCDKAHYAADVLTQVDGLELMFDQPFFKEFTLKCDNEGGVEEILNRAKYAGFGIGPELKPFGLDIPEADKGILIAVTEKRTRMEIDCLAEALKG